MEKDIDEMAGANMSTRDVHQHLKKSGWSLSRTSGGHDVYTHPKSEKNIAVPRHKKLKAPLVLGIMKTAKQINEIEESVAIIPTRYPDHWSRERVAAAQKKETSDYVKDLRNAHKDVQSLVNKIKASKPDNQPKWKHNTTEETMKGKDPCWKGYEMIGKKMKGGKEVPNCVPVKEQIDDTPFDPPYSDKPSTVKDKSGAVHGPMSTAKHLARLAMKRQAERLKDKPIMKTTQAKPEMQRESLQESRRAEIVREAMQKAKDKKKNDKKVGSKTDKFEAEPELSTEITKTDV